MRCECAQLISPILSVHGSRAEHLGKSAATPNEFAIDGNCDCAIVLSDDDATLSLMVTLDMLSPSVSECVWDAECTLGWSEVECNDRSNDCAEFDSIRSSIEFDDADFI